MTVQSILFADNEPDFLNTRAEHLESAGYRVLKAYTLEQARRLLSESHVHVAILDIRMVNDDDERDVSGLSLAQDPTYQLIPKIILTSFPDTEKVRESLRIQPDGHPAAVDFLSKTEGPESMIQAVKRAFALYVRLNQNLHIYWDERERLSFLQLADLLHNDQPNNILVQRAEELQDLFCCLFYDYSQIRISRMLWHDRWRFCLSVLAQSSQGVTDRRILICGERSRLVSELKHVQELAPDIVQGTQLKGKAETIHFCAITYALSDADLETIQTLRDIFRGSRERSLKAGLDHLLREVLAIWHRRGQMLATADLLALFRRQAGLEENVLPRTEVERRIEAMIHALLSFNAVQIERSDGTITFHFLQERPLAYSDPVTTIYAPLEQYRSPVLCRISPGQLTADNVLIDGNHKSWLTDFAYAGQAPQWWDFICLEAIIRFDLCQAPDLLAWQEFEECMVRPTELQARLPVQDVAAELRTCTALIEQIRRQAGSETGNDPLPYYAGILVWTVGSLSHYDPTKLYTRAELMRGVHLLLAAAMLAGQLSKAPTVPVPDSGGRLYLDDEGGVRIGSRRIVDLSEQEMALVRCLYERKGKLVDRSTILQSVFAEQYQTGNEQQESRINSLLRRLRLKIEPDPDHPRHILTVKGRGYYLQVGDESGSGQ
jgi:DNA-binding response OmpR family regulator